jgi:Flp pilus assembly protein TadB
MHSDVSGYVVPLGAFAVGIVAIVAGAFSQQHREKLRADQRMAMVARGMNTEDIDKLLGKASNDGRVVKDPLQSLARARRAAIVLISTGVGLMLFSAVLTWILNVHEVLSAGAAGLIPLAIGVGFLIDYNLQKRDLARFGLEVGRVE